MLGLSFTGANKKLCLMPMNFITIRGEYQASRMHIVSVSQHVLGVGVSGTTSVG